MWKRPETPPATARKSCCVILAIAAANPSSDHSEVVWARAAWKEELKPKPCDEHVWYNNTIVGQHAVAVLRLLLPWQTVRRVDNGPAATVSDKLSCQLRRIVLHRKELTLADRSQA